ncbi:MAG: hypothetical protein ACKVGW_19230 [Verrucomicrobiia bacterium]
MKLFSGNRWLIVTTIHYLTLFVFSEINTYLSPWGINILITGMLISFSSLVLSHAQGALSLIPVAFYLDSRSPLPFGSSLIILIGLHYVIVGFRYQFRRESGGISLAVSLIANIAIHLLYTLFTIIYLGSEGLSSLQIGLNLLCSSLVIVGLNPFYLLFLIRFLGLFGIRIAQEQRQAR